MEYLGIVLGIIVAVGTICGAVLKGGQWLYKKFMAKKECQIHMSPFLDTIPPVLNGGTFQGNAACFQVRFGSDANLQLVDAVLIHRNKIIPHMACEIRLEAGRNWNSFQFPSSELPFVPAETFLLKIRVADHSGNCCDLTHDLQMKQFPHPEVTGRNSGRWEIHSVGIFRVSCAKQKKITL